jgi:hypothetical protein
MKLEEIITKSKEVKAPMLKKESKSEPLKLLINRLKKSDRDARKHSRGIQVLYIVMVLFWIFRIIIDNNYLSKIGFGILTVASFIVIFYNQLHYERNNRSYFAISNIDFLKETKKRLKFLANRIWYIIIWALFDLGFCFLIVSDFSHRYSIAIGPILIMQLILAIAISAELYFGYRKWKKIRKPFITEIEHILQEIQEA